MQRSWKKIRGIPPLRGGDFQGIAGLSSDDSLLAENQNEGCQGPLRTKRLPSLTGGLEVKLLFSTSGQGRNIFLDIPLYRTGVYAQSPSLGSFGPHYVGLLAI